MAVFIVLILLVMGYVYINSVPYEKALLKRSTGWETYVILAKYGLIFGIKSLIKILDYLLVLFAIVIGSAGILAIFGPTNSYTNLFKMFAIAYNFIENFEIFGTKGVIESIVVLFFAWEACLKAIDKERDTGLHKLKNYDSFLNIVLTAMDKQIPVKVSLKSRKIYVGAILDEQFEHVNFDNISIIPHLSGYRDKDTLKITFDCNYSEIYQKRGIKEISESTNTENMQSLSDFRLNIKVNEIESISLFYQEVFNDFNPPVEKNLLRKLKKLV